MSSGNFCGLKPLVFCRKLSRMQVSRELGWRKLHRNRKETKQIALPTSSSAASLKKKRKEIKRMASQLSSLSLSKSFDSMKRVASSLSVKNHKKVKTTKYVEDSSSCRPNFILMVELKKNILTFRDMIDLPSLDASLSVTKIVIRTMKDLQKLSSEIVRINKSIDMDDADMDKMFIFFYEDLRAIGDSWIMDHDWIQKSKYKHNGVGKTKSDRLVEHVLAALDGLIIMLRERFDMMELEYDGKKEFCAKGSSQGRRLNRSVSFSDSTNSVFTSPITPTSVLPGITTASPSLWNLRAQALEKLSPAEVKRLALQILSQREEQTLLDLEPQNNVIYEEDVSDEAEKQGEDDEEEDAYTNHIYGLVEENESETDVATLGSSESTSLNLEYTSETVHELQEHEEEQGEQAVSCSSMVLAPPSLSMLNKVSPPPPPPLPQPLTILTETSTSSSPPQPPPLPQTNKAPKEAEPHTPPPPPPPGSLTAAKSMGGKKSSSKLRRSAQIANLYWVLKGKLEGRGVDGKRSKVKRSIADRNVAAATASGSVGGGKPGMADALAEMTKRSAYFQQIEDDVHKYAKSINELKSDIHSFETKDMKELLEFHSKVESVLEKLSDETQVLARFEEFPQKKLETIRTAGALYIKLDGILNELKNWDVKPPLNDLLEKIERYFNKVKGEIEALERTKDEQAKMFKSHKINIDFDILVQIKESMVDVSSNCMELALKERREANETKNRDERRETKKPVEARRLWRAFQFAFKVYSFAGGHDDRADHLTRQLAHEIETDPQADHSPAMKSI